jgi:hypothetical protein
MSGEIIERVGGKAEVDYSTPRKQASRASGVQRTRSAPVRKVRRVNANVISIYEEHGDGRSNSRLFYREADGWHPPLPPDVAAELPVEQSRSIMRSSSRTTPARPASSLRPYWQLQRDSWRLT